MRARITATGSQQGRSSTDTQTCRSGTLQKLTPVDIVRRGILFDKLIQSLTIVTIKNGHKVLLVLYNIQQN